MRPTEERLPSLLIRSLEGDTIAYHSFLDDLTRQLRGFLRKRLFYLQEPGFLAIVKAVGGLAPTRLRLAGASAGLLAGATATVAYCLHCLEMGVPFWAVWYVLGMAIPTAAGALLGPKMIRR